MEINEKDVIEGTKSFKHFLNTIFWKSYDDIKPTHHLNNWADLFQFNKNLALLSARRHLKSTITYAYVMWQIFRSVRENKEILYISLKEDLARYHIRKIKQLIEKNPYFTDYKSLSPAEGEIKGTWAKSISPIYAKLRQEQVVYPSGMESLKRGRRADLIICDDILADPTIQLEPVKIEKANRIFFEEIMSIVREGGEIKVVGTAQHPSDLFFKLKENKTFAWSFNPAIINHENKEVLWPELFNFERLIELRDIEIGERAFLKEYQCHPVWSEDAFFKRDKLIIDNSLKNLMKTEGKTSRTRIIAGLDIGKHSHPSHFAVFELRNDDNYYMIFEMFFDNWDYSHQVEYINAMCENLIVDQLRFDNTRGELESFMERGICHRSLWKPVNFTIKEKSALASNFERLVDQGRVKLINDERMIKSILAVNNDLDALETPEGHGDAFWSIALALSCKASIPIDIIGVK